MYAHAADRDWEADSDMPDDALGLCPDIASQFIDDERNQQIRVGICYEHALSHCVIFYTLFVLKNGNMSNDIEIGIFTHIVVYI